MSMLRWNRQQRPAQGGTAAQALHFFQRMPACWRLCGTVTVADTTRPASTLGKKVLSLVTAGQGGFGQWAGRLAHYAT